MIHHFSAAETRSVPGDNLGVRYLLAFKLLTSSSIAAETVLDTVTGRITAFPTLTGADAAPLVALRNSMTDEAWIAINTRSMRAHFSSGLVPRCLPVDVQVAAAIRMILRQATVAD